MTSTTLIKQVDLPPRIIEWNIRKTTSRHHDAGNIDAVVNAVVTKQNQNFRYKFVGDLFYVRLIINHYRESCCDECEIPR